MSKRRVFPKRDRRNQPFVKAGRVLRNIPNLSYNQFCYYLREELGSLPKRSMISMMYDDYISYQEGMEHD